MAYSKSLTLWTDGANQLRVSSLPSGGLLFEMPGEHGWEDAEEAEVSPEDVKILIDFLNRGGR